MTARMTIFCLLIAGACFLSGFLVGLDQNDDTTFEFRPGDRNLVLKWCPGEEPILVINLRDCEDQ